MGPVVGYTSPVKISFICLSACMASRRPDQMFQALRTSTLTDHDILNADSIQFISDNVPVNKTFV